MKKTFFLFTMLASVAASAQTLNIKITAIDYSTKIATCDLSWTGRNDTHRSDVWVFVDYIEISGSTTTGSWKPAAITGATVTKNTTGNAAASTVSGNTRGVWVKSSTSGANFTGEVKLQLSNVPAVFNSCAYASDYPPNAASYSGGTYTFKGTKPFIVNGTTVNDNKYAVTTITSLTDATGCPGGVGRDVVHNNGKCLSHLTAVNGYCRDLAADGASTNVSCGYEVKLSNTTLAAGCPSGWSVATVAIMECMRGKNTEFGLGAGSYATANTTTKGHLQGLSWCTTCTAHFLWIDRDYVSPDACSLICDIYCAGNIIRWYPDCTALNSPVKCIR